MNLKNLFCKHEIIDTWPFTIGAITDGEIVPMEQIPDPVFSTGILGFCCGINSVDGCIYAPTDGIITEIASTLHAIGIVCDNGVELLLHLGVDTVKLKGNGFCCMTKKGARVKQGQKLLKMDLNVIASAGYDATAITCVANSDDYTNVRLLLSGQVQQGDAILSIEKEK